MQAMPNTEKYAQQAKVVHGRFGRDFSLIKKSQVICGAMVAIHAARLISPVLVEPATKRVLWVGRGRSRVDVQPFFELLGAAGRRHLNVVMDMNGAYEEEVRYQCPLAEIVYDLFHVVAKYGREVVDRVRVDEAT